MAFLCWNHLRANTRKIETQVTCHRTLIGPARCRHTVVSIRAAEAVVRSASSVCGLATDWAGSAHFWARTRSIRALAVREFAALILHFDPRLNSRTKRCEVIPWPKP